jgi:hypothetical protein
MSHLETAQPLRGFSTQPGGDARNVCVTVTHPLRLRHIPGGIIYRIKNLVVSWNYCHGGRNYKCGRHLPLGAETSALLGALAAQGLRRVATIRGHHQESLTGNLGGQTADGS